MNMPQFTAEASLSEPREHYQYAAGQVGPMSRGILPQLKDSDIPGATCGKAPVFGNVICVQCTTGPSATCKTYVCDKNGSNCKQTSLVRRQVLIGSLAGTRNIFHA